MGLHVPWKSAHRCPQTSVRLQGGILLAFVQRVGGKLAHRPQKVAPCNMLGVYVTSGGLSVRSIFKFDPMGLVVGGLPISSCLFSEEYVRDLFRPPRGPVDLTSG